MVDRLPKTITGENHEACVEFEFNVERWRVTYRRIGAIEFLPMLDACHSRQSAIDVGTAKLARLDREARYFIQQERERINKLAEATQSFSAGFRSRVDNRWNIFFATDEDAEEWQEAREADDFVGALEVSGAWALGIEESGGGTDA